MVAVEKKKKKKNEIAHHVRKCIDAEPVAVKNNGKRDLHILPSDLNRVMLHGRVYWCIFPHQSRKIDLSQQTGNERINGQLVRKETIRRRSEIMNSRQ